jgi:hypothetical protein
MLAGMSITSLCAVPEHASYFSNSMRLSLVDEEDAGLKSFATREPTTIHKTA